MYRIQYNSPVILSFTLAAIAVYAANSFMLGALTPLFSLQPGFNPANPISYFQLFSYTLGHASIEHISGNLIYILLLGPVIEEKYGSIPTLYMMLATAFVTAVVHLLLFPQGLIGASGLVFMFIILVSFTNVQVGRIPLTFIIIAGLFIGKEIFASMQQDNISQFAHIFGGIIGSLFGFTAGSVRSQMKTH